MGCCISAGSRAEPEEETETVKEVLVETVPVADQGMKALPEVNLVDGDAAGSTPEIIRSHLEDKGNGEIQIQILSHPVSEVSEICSYTETPTATEERKDDDDDDDDEEGVVNQRPPLKKRRLPGGGRGRGRGRGRRPIAVAPEKRGQVAPLHGRSIAGQLRNQVQLENGRRGEGSGRRGGEGFVPPRRELGVGRNDGVAVEEVESLENPIVSLECFIFL